MDQFPYSKSAVKRAAERVRDYLLSIDGIAPEGYVEPDEGQLVADIVVIRAWRASHQRPLTKAAMGLRSMVATERFEVEVSQRLKRLPTIVDKLMRQPSMSLSRMQDIGGCRAVLNSIEEVYAVQRRIRRNGREERARDYIAEPAPSGYRGVHVLTVYDERMIEIQLRTQIQHEWAVTVERVGSRTGYDLKSGVGPQPILDLLSTISEAIALEERGLLPDSSLASRLSTLRSSAEPWLRGDS